MFNLYSKIKAFFKQSPWLGELFVFVAMLGLYLPLQKSLSFADPDSFYHLKMAELIAAHGPVRSFIWMPFTTLATAFADQHFLYHVALIPWIEIFGPLTGMKLATAFLAALAIAALAWSMRYMGIRYAWFFALLAGIMNPLAFRIGLSKASAPGVALLMIGLALAARRRKWPLAIVAFIYVWTHGSWPALVALGTVMIVTVSWGQSPYPYIKGAVPVGARLLRRLWPPRNDGFKSLLALWAGAIVGMIANPNLPQNLKFYWEQIVQIAVINYQSKIGVGAEWYPYAPARLANDLPLLCLLAFVALVVFPVVVALAKEKAENERGRIALALAVCALAFLVLTLRSQRHVEYFVPLAVAACAAWIMALPTRAALPFLKKNIPTVALLTLGAVALVLAYAGRGLVQARRDLAGSYGFTTYQKAGEYLQTKSAPHEIVVNANWDEMPPLFYWDDKNEYIMGLDPTFMYSANAARYWDYVNFTLGKAKDPAAVMKELAAHYVFSDRAHYDLDRMLEASGKFQRVYIDKDAEIYLLK